MVGWPDAARCLTARHGGSPCADRAEACTLKMRSGCEGGGKGPLVQYDKSATLGCRNDQYLFCLQGSMIDRDARQNGSGMSAEPMFTLNATDRHGICAAFKAGQGAGAGGIGWAEELSPTLPASPSGTNRTPAVLCRAGTNANAELCEDLAPTLTCKHEEHIVFRKAGKPHSGKEAPRYRESEVANTLNTFDTGESRCNEIVYCPETTHTLKAKANCDYWEDSAEKLLRWIVRRLTPTECARLQGYPDDWCRIPDTVVNGRKVRYSDSAAYKAYGNSIALPQWWWLTCRMAAYLPECATLGSLFDGIGGFPLVWETRNGKGTACWASEIDPFAIAVTQYHFGEERYNANQKLHHKNRRV